MITCWVALDDTRAQGGTIEYVVQDKIPLRLSEPIPQTPEEERAHAELKVAPTAAPSA
jgi:hypothetical protein